MGLQEPPGAASLTGPDAGRVLGHALAADGAALERWHVRSVHRRGATSVAVVYEAVVTTGGRQRERLLVGHASTRSVPREARRVTTGDGAVVHVWRFPHDPYLPGLADVVHRERAAALLADVLDPTAPDELALRTRSYRPTRRAVVEFRPGPDREPVAYAKVLGGRTRERILRRSEQLVTLHDHLAAALPVPPVLAARPRDGTVLLGALPGTTLRSALRGGDQLPEPDAICDLLARLHALPPPPDGGDPDGFADVGRHVALLQARVPERAAALEELATAGAAVAGPVGTVHGDLHDGQVLLLDGRVTGVLDVDGAGTGRVAHDLGRLLAHLDASRLAAPDATRRVDQLVRELRHRFGDLAPAEDVTAAAAAAWVGLATGPIRVASDDWRAEATARIDRGIAWLRSPTDGRSPT